ncbi:hypothetical protein BS50DRAFT_575311 [Corynespora cassiicola Philippines]|uniref:C2H2-type domain-containing protein n=1 Tax=Corynespora cassiicola Philippines TaxID=1448308 RepID=A0A2T2NIK7_CORCC|nr:hypothetical protein BS50DRAFT_575311 [Corynespora cassiicola Philippines]
MTKKRKRYPDLNQKLERPWCYYCERDFDDLKILISHQKAKHFKCDRCGRRLNTAGGLSVHMNQVHKETLSHVENAVQGRQSLDIEIFGMEGVPQEIIEIHNRQVTEKHFAEETERARVTGNPIRGLYTNGAAPPTKRPKVDESVEEIIKRAQQYHIDKENGVIPAPAPEAPANPTPPALTGFPVPPGVQAPPFPVPAPNYPPSAPALGVPPRPGSIPGQPSLPQRPGFFDPSVAPSARSNASPPVADSNAIAASLEELISDAKGAAAATNTASAEPPAEKKAKKEKNVNLKYNDDKVSPEEKIALLPRFQERVRV